MKSSTVFAGDHNNWRLKSFTKPRTRYREPAQISFVERLLVPEEKSSFSRRATLKPRVWASKAAPHPVAPPPRTSTSNSFPDFNSAMFWSREFHGDILSHRTCHVGQCYTMRWKCGIGANGSKGNR